MVARKNRPQVRGLGQAPQLAVQRAQQVPFIPATRRSGVGDNEQRLGSALSRLGSAIGSLPGNKKQSQAEYDAENRRYSKFVKERSKDDPETRATWRQVHMKHPTQEAIGTADDVNHKIWPSMQKNIGEQVKAWQDNGWKIKSVDEDGNEVEEPITQDYLNQWFKEFKNLQVYDVYGDGRGEKGRLRSPQYGALLNGIDKTHQQISQEFFKYQKVRQQQEGRAIVSRDTLNVLTQAKEAGVDLRTALTMSGRKLYHDYTGREVGNDSPEARRILEGQLSFLTDNTKNMQAVRLGADLWSSQAANGLPMSQQYKEQYAAWQRKAKSIVDADDTAAALPNLTAMAIQDMHKKNLTDVETWLQGKTLQTSTGKAITISSKKLKDSIVGKLREQFEANVTDDPDENSMNRQKMLKFLRGTTMTLPEYKTQFSTVDLNVQDPSEVKALMDIYKDIESADPTKIDLYMGKKEKVLFSTLTSLMELYPGMTPETAIDNVKRGMVDGRIPTWTELGRQNSDKLQGQFHQTLRSSFPGMTQEDREEAAQVFRLRVASGEFSGDDERTTASELKAAMKEAGKAWELGQVKIGDQYVRKPVGLDMSPEAYKGHLEVARQDIANLLKVDPDQVSVQSLGSDGVVFKDKSGNILKLKDEQGSYAAVYHYRDLLKQAGASRSGQAVADAMRSLGPRSFGRHAKTMQKEIENARKQKEKNSSFWSWVSGGFKAPANPEKPEQRPFR